MHPPEKRYFKQNSRVMFKINIKISMADLLNKKLYPVNYLISGRIACGRHILKKSRKKNLVPNNQFIFCMLIKIALKNLL